MDLRYSPQSHELQFPSTAPSLGLCKMGWFLDTQVPLTFFIMAFLPRLRCKLLQKSSPTPTDPPCCLNHSSSPGQVAQLVGASSCTPKGCGFKSWSGHIARLRVQSPVGACTRGNQLTFLSHIYVSLSLSLPSTVSRISEHTLR